MCLTLDALIVFLNILGPELVTTEPDRFIIHTNERNVQWVETDGKYCTMAPQLDRTARFEGTVSDD